MIDWLQVGLNFGGLSFVAGVVILAVGLVAKHQLTIRIGALVLLLGIILSAVCGQLILEGVGA